MTTLRVTVSVLLAFLPAGGHCSICMLHKFHDKFYTDLNYMIRENGKSILWYVLAYRQPDLPYRTLYHIPNDLATNRNCYSYLLSTQFGVIFMDFMCHGKVSLHSYDILTRPDGVYVTAKKYPNEATDFRMVHVLRLTKNIVLLVSCSSAMDTYGVLVLHRGPWLPAQDEAYFHGITIAKFPAPLHRWMNFTMTSVSVGEERCNCSKEYTIAIRTSSAGGIEQDKRKMFVLVTLGAAFAIAVLVKFLKRLL